MSKLTDRALDAAEAAAESAATYGVQWGGHEFVVNWREVAEQAVEAYLVVYLQGEI